MRPFIASALVLCLSCRPVSTRPDAVASARPSPETAPAAPPATAAAEDAPSSGVASAAPSGSVTSAAPPAEAVLSTARDALAHADQVELFYLDPDPEAALRDGGTRFHGYVVREHAAARAADRAPLGAAVLRGIDTWGGALARCFEPRHGIRATAGGAAHDFVICYQCSRIEIDGRPEPVVGTAPGVEPAVDAIFAHAGLKRQAR